VDRLSIEEAISQREIFLQQLVDEQLRLSRSGAALTIVMFQRRMLLGKAILGGEHMISYLRAMQAEGVRYYP
jgi:hypothetical protein